MKPNAIARQSGMMLLEALFGILLFSIGIIALVGMQTSAVKQSVESKYRSDASMLASQLIGKLWASSHTFATMSTLYNTGAIVNGNCGACAPDFNTWLSTVNTTLPAAATHPPTIAYTQLVAGSVPSTRVTITLFWQSPGADTTVHSYVTIAEFR
jgi:type IV pilus assembly protein PilV